MKVLFWRLYIHVGSFHYKDDSSFPVKDFAIAVADQVRNDGPAIKTVKQPVAIDCGS